LPSYFAPTHIPEKLQVLIWYIYIVSLWVWQRGLGGQMVGGLFRGSEANVKLQIARTNLQHKLVYATACARRGVFFLLTCGPFSDTIFYGRPHKCAVLLLSWLGLTDLALTALYWQECMQIAVTCRKFAFAAHRYE